MGKVRFSNKVPLMAYKNGIFLLNIWLFQMYSVCTLLLCLFAFVHCSEEKSDDLFEEFCPGSRLQTFLPLKSASFIDANHLLILHKRYFLLARVENFNKVIIFHLTKQIKQGDFELLPPESYQSVIFIKPNTLLEIFNDGRSRLKGPNGLNCEWKNMVKFNLLPGAAQRGLFLRFRKQNFLIETHFFQSFVYDLRSEINNCQAFEMKIAKTHFIMYHGQYSNWKRFTFDSVMEGVAGTMGDNFTPFGYVYNDWIFFYAQLHQIFRFNFSKLFLKFIEMRDFEIDNEQLDWSDVLVCKAPEPIETLNLMNFVLFGLAEAFVLILLFTIILVFVSRKNSPKKVATSRTNTSAKQTFSSHSSKK